MSRELFVSTLTTQFDVKPEVIKETDSTELLGKAMDAAYRATPSDYVIDARGLAAARRQAGTNAANLTLAMGRTPQPATQEALRDIALALKVGER